MNTAQRRPFAGRFVNPSQTAGVSGENAPLRGAQNCSARHSSLVLEARSERAEQQRGRKRKAVFLRLGRTDGSRDQEASLKLGLE